MKPLYRGLLLGGLQLVLVTTLGAKLVIDRARLPRVWARTAPVDPNLPIRGRYVSLRVEAQALGFDTQGKPNHRGWRDRGLATLKVENGQLVAVRSNDSKGLRVGILDVPGRGTIAQIQEPLAFFIPEHVPDPSRRSADEELWVEVTVPRKGPPRPIRLGVKKGETITPLDLD